MTTIVLASSNSGKLAELSDLFKDQGIDVRPQSQWDVTDADETGLSFIENAILKARHAAKHTGLAAIADDSGLAVDALEGAPGIYSARFASKPSDANHSKDDYNNQKLLDVLTDVADHERSARYHCVLAYVRNESDPTPQLFMGTWEGRILRAPQGDGGFGYDPIFYVPSHNCSAAELDKATKNQLSHRAQAMAQLRQRWVS